MSVDIFSAGHGGPAVPGPAIHLLVCKNSRVELVWTLSYQIIGFLFLTASVGKQTAFLFFIFGTVGESTKTGY